MKSVTNYVLLFVDYHWRHKERKAYRKVLLVVLNAWLHTVSATTLPVVGVGRASTVSTVTTCQSSQDYIVTGHATQDT